jgi:hypothetical protein
LDVFDTANLFKRAKSDPNIPKDAIDKIETVDLVGSASAIAELVEQRESLASFDYVISSHNFEHLPDPIRFLQGCQRVLKPSGTISMAVPDQRVCYDYFRPRSITADFIEAFFERRQRPTPAQIFAERSLSAHVVKDGRVIITFPLNKDPSRVLPQEILEESYRQWQAVEQDRTGTYQDVHCWVFTPASLELILRNLQFLDLVRLDVVEVTQSNGPEFYVHLRQAAGSTNAKSSSEFYRRRRELLHRINREVADHTIVTNELKTMLNSRSRLFRRFLLLCWQKASRPRR